jgi:hypothetical protein
MKRTLGVVVTRHIWLGIVEDHQLTDTHVFPSPGGGFWDIRSMPSDQVAETIREQIARVIRAQPVDAIGLGFRASCGTASWKEFELSADEGIQSCRRTDGRTSR